MIECANQKISITDESLRENIARAYINETGNMSDEDIKHYSNQFISRFQTLLALITDEMQQAPPTSVIVLTGDDGHFLGGFMTRIFSSLMPHCSIVNHLKEFHDALLNAVGTNEVEMGNGFLASESGKLRLKTNIPFS